MPGSGKVLRNRLYRWENWHPESKSDLPQIPPLQRPETGKGTRSSCSTPRVFREGIQPKRWATVIIFLNSFQPPYFAKWTHNLYRNRKKRRRKKEPKLNAIWWWYKGDLRHWITSRSLLKLSDLVPSRWSTRHGTARHESALENDRICTWEWQRRTEAQIELQGLLVTVPIFTTRGGCLPIFFFPCSSCQKNCPLFSHHVAFSRPAKKSTLPSFPFIGGNFQQRLEEWYRNLEKCEFGYKSHVIQQMKLYIVWE